MKEYIKFSIIVVFFLISTYLVYVINSLDLLPNKYIAILIIFLLIINIASSILILLKKKITTIIGIIIYILLFVFNVIGLKYGQETIEFLDKAFNNRLFEITTYNVLVLKESNYSSLEDLNKATMVYLRNDPYSLKWNKEIVNKIDIQFFGSDDLYELYNNLLDQVYSSAIIDEAYMDLLEDEDPYLEEKVKVIYKYSVSRKIKVNKEVEKLEPINIFISGSDSRSDKIYNKSRSDVNMILTINPNTNTILTTSIPRDYYVMVRGQTGLKDKLTHAGIYGLDISRLTVADLFDVPIQYGIKVGFKSVVEVVDLLGGIDVDSDRTFNSYHIKGWTVQKGINHMNGKEALAYARERYAYPEGDRHRVQNQQQVLECIIKKATSNSDILFDYENILNSFASLYVTDIPAQYIKLLVKKQIDTNEGWKFIRQTVSGSDAHEVTHVTPNTKLYVMVPYQQQVKSAHDKILEVMEG